MKRTLAVLFILIVSMVTVFADAHLGRTEAHITDDSFVVQAYYKGEKETTSVTFTFKDANGTEFSHNHQTSEGSTVSVSNNHLGNNTGTIFTWTMVGSSNSKTTLKFTFSTLQAEMNERFYCPTYTLTMTINQTKRDGYNTTLDDSFYTDATKTQVVGGGTTTGTKAVQDVEFSGSASVTYTGKYTGNRTWNRSGTCTLNISDYEQEVPGTYNYRCWVIAEFSID